MTRFMELSLVGLFFIGLERGSVGIIINTGVALLVTRVPSILERDYQLAMDPKITLWITSAAFLHALGTVGVPGLGWKPYSAIPWWDHATHALSASVVAAAGYATVRAIDEHSEKVHLPSKFVAAIILLFVLAFGVLWELLEFALGIAADQLGTSSVLTQYGVYDTLWDLVYNSIGAVLVALWGGLYLSDLSDAIGERFLSTD
ncbi:putative membrane protein [Halapricum desulfuricans]|uniref:Putative membrane protein n=2 Tax=Halapricum desulfuricans TaxID=2841257 RepID=A0A897NDL6_9EURY|nr:putative membrane protein [Halapricum desulfuricans]QSG12500.1 putative membrane protein [Halapricum desulfuricans]